MNQISFLDKIKNRGNRAVSIIEILKGQSIEECIATLEAVKRRILSMVKLTENDTENDTENE